MSLCSVLVTCHYMSSDAEPCVKSADDKTVCCLDLPVITLGNETTIIDVAMVATPHTVVRPPSSSFSCFSMAVHPGSNSHVSMAMHAGSNSHVSCVSMAGGHSSVSMMVLLRETES